LFYARRRRSTNSDVQLLIPGATVPEDHALRAIREFADGMLDELWGTSDQMYLAIGRRSIAPEKSLHALRCKCFIPCAASAY
jgi:hypothetical protein